MIDMTGKPVSKRDIEEAILVVKKSMVTELAKLPPGLAVQLPNILRCLQEFEKTK